MSEQAAVEVEVPRLYGIHVEVCTSEEGTKCRKCGDPIRHGEQFVLRDPMFTIFHVDHYTRHVATRRPTCLTCFSKILQKYVVAFTQALPDSLLIKRMLKRKGGAIDNKLRKSIEIVVDGSSDEVRKVRAFLEFARSSSIAEVESEAS